MILLLPISFFLLISNVSSENYTPIRHKDKQKVLSEGDIRKAVAKMEQIMGYNIPVDRTGLIIEFYGMLNSFMIISKKELVYILTLNTITGSLKILNEENLATKTSE